MQMRTDPEFYQCRLDLQASTLVGPTGTRPVLDPLAVLQSKITLHYLKIAP